MLQGYGSIVSNLHVQAELTAYYAQDDLDAIGYDVDGTPTPEAFCNPSEEYDSFSDESSCPRGYCALSQEELDILF